MQNKKQFFIFIVEPQPIFAVTTHFTIHSLIFTFLWVPWHFSIISILCVCFFYFFHLNAKRQHFNACFKGRRQGAGVSRCKHSNFLILYIDEKNHINKKGWKKLEKDTLGVGKKKKTQAFPKKDEKSFRYRGARQLLFAWPVTKKSNRIV